MIGIHTNWTKPYEVNIGGEYKIEDFELFTTILSALKWREKNGPIVLYADKTALEYYKKTGIAELYSDIKELNVDNEINPNMFWAAGKLFALREQGAPAAVIDTDFIVWDSILFDKLGECTVIHFEDLYPSVYPPVEVFDMKSGYTLPDFNMSLKACNTAFYVIKSQKLVQDYTETAIEFMKNANRSDDRLRHMVFAEQRLLNMCADKLGIEIMAFSNLERLYEDGYGFFTHVWGMKQQMRENGALRKSFCRRCADRIKHDYPQYSDLADKILTGNI